MLGKILSQVRLKKPLIHCITNYVTANDCANILLACGASAIMADDPLEAEEITSVCAGLVINMGTPNPRKTEAMMKSGETANRLGIPVILDPVGVGSSSMRREAVRRMLDRLRFAAIRGNADEIAALAGGTKARCGVDAGATSDVDSIVSNAKLLARESGAVVIVTGDTDIITDGRWIARVHNGHAIMRSITGAGCQLSALLGAYISANVGRPFEAALAAVCAMGLSGETAHGRLGLLDGNASCRNYIIDAIYNLSAEALEKGARYEIDA